MSIPLSLSQAMMLATPDTTVPGLFPLPARYDPVALSRALDLVISRHQPLRMRLHVAEDGSGTQEFTDAPGSGTGTGTGTGVLSVQDVASVEDTAVEFCAQKLDITREAPIRAAVLREAGGRAGLVVQIHHMATDGWGFGRFADELRTCYAALQSGRAPRLPQLDLSFEEYVATETAAGARLTPEQYDYWSTLLAGCQPYEFTDAAAGEHTGASARHDTSNFTALDPASTALVAEFATKTRVPNVVLVLTAVAVAAMSQHGQKDLLLKSTHLGRDVPGTMDIVGCFARATFLRVVVDEAMTVGELVTDVRRQWMDSMRYSAPPFSVAQVLYEMIVAGEIDGDMLGRLCRALTLNYFNFNMNGWSEPRDDDPVLGVPVPLTSPLNIADELMPFLVVAWFGTTLNLAGVLNMNRYPSGKVVDFFRRIKAVLEGMVKFGPDAPIGSLP